MSKDKLNLIRTTFEVEESLWEEFIQRTEFLRRDKFLNSCIDEWINGRSFLKSQPANSDLVRTILKNHYWDIFGSNADPCEPIKISIFLDKEISKNLTDYCNAKGISRSILFNSLIDWLCNGTNEGGSVIGLVDEILNNPVEKIIEIFSDSSEDMSFYRLSNVYMSDEAALERYFGTSDFGYLREAIAFKYGIPEIAADKKLKQLAPQELLKVRSNPGVKSLIKQQIEKSKMTDLEKLSFDDLLGS